MAMAATCLSLPAAASAEETSGGTTHSQFTKIDDAGFVVAGKDATGGDGFLGSYKAFSMEEIEAISSEAEADKYFSSNKYQSYLTDVTFSGKRQGIYEAPFVASGLSIKAIADSLGIDATKADTWLMSNTTDDHPGQVEDIFKTRYYFDENVTTPKWEVEPMLALSGTDSKGDDMKGETPRIMFGQDKEDDFQMNNWNKYVATMYFSGTNKSTSNYALEIDVKGKNYAGLDITEIMTWFGRYTTTYTAYRNGEPREYSVEGVPLSEVLKEFGLNSLFGSGSKNTIEVQTSDGYEFEEITADKVDDTFIAWKFTEGENKGESDTELILLTDGESANSSKCKSVTGINIDIATPAKVKAPTLKKSGSKNVKISWKKVNGATHYQIARRAAGKKKYGVIKRVKALLKWIHNRRRLRRTGGSQASGTRPKTGKEGQPDEKAHFPYQILPLSDDRYRCLGVFAGGGEGHPQHGGPGDHQYFQRHFCLSVHSALCAEGRLSPRDAAYEKGSFLWQRGVFMQYGGHAGGPVLVFGQRGFDFAGYHAGVYAGRGRFMSGRGHDGLEGCGRGPCHRRYRYHLYRRDAYR